jgi:hypothetical protein
VDQQVAVDEDRSPPPAQRTAKETEVLARVAHLDLARPAYTAAVLKFPKRNIGLRHGA